MIEFFILGIFSSFRNLLMSLEIISFVKVFFCFLIFWMSVFLLNNFEKFIVIIFKKKKEIVEISIKI